MEAAVVERETEARCNTTRPITSQAARTVSLWRPLKQLYLAILAVVILVSDVYAGEIISRIPRITDGDTLIIDDVKTLRRCRCP